MSNLLLTISAGAVWGKIWPILIAILFFGLIIFLHELGHFTFAKIFGVQVNEFAMGMGPALFKFKKGETQYALRLFPIGGFVSMEGEDEGSDNPRAFCNAAAWKRLIIVAAGGVINLIMGIVLVGLMLSAMELIGTTQVYSFNKDAVSCNYGLKEDDVITKINGRRVYSEFDMSYMMTRDEDGVYDYTVKRDGKTVELKDVKFKTVKEGEKLTVIYDYSIVGVEPTFANVMKCLFPESISFARLVYMSLFDLCTGHYGISDLSGPIGTVTYIADAAQSSAENSDYSYLWTLCAMIAVNIGLFNLLPLPALDGGRLFFILVEMIFRKPVPRKYEGWVHAAGMVLLLILMAVISFSDIMKLIRGEF